MTGLRLEVFHLGAYSLQATLQDRPLRDMSSNVLLPLDLQVRGPTTLVLAKLLNTLEMLGRRLQLRGLVGNVGQEGLSFHLARN